MGAASGIALFQFIFRPTGALKEQNVLGSCGPADFEKDFEGAPRKNIYYPISVAEKIRGIELTGPERPDMIAEFNKDINWYFGTDGNTPSMMYDFVSVVLHEIGHGLGFTGFFFALDNTGGYSFFDWGDATSFDRLISILKVFNSSTVLFLTILHCG
jgi:hypothetical protein